MKSKCAWTIFAGLFLISCAETTEPAEAEDSLIEPSTGKDDSGFVSDRSIEVEGHFTSTVRVDVYDLPGEGTDQEKLDALLASDWQLFDVLSNQVKYARKTLQDRGFHLNQATSEVVEVQGTLDGSEAIIDYTAVVDSVVTLETIDQHGGIEGLLEESFTIALPTRMSFAGGLGFDCTPHREFEPSKVFYYYDPNIDGCQRALNPADPVDALYQLENVADVQTVYPEYDRIADDGVFNAAIFFGAADDDWTPESEEQDWGMWSHDRFVSSLRTLGFERKESDIGSLFVRERDGLVAEIELIGPDVLASLKDDPETFANVSKRNEVVLYNGHSFYGTLDVLHGPEAYSDDYQIFYFSSCWSYGHYATKPFRHKVGADDPLGWAGVDVVVDNAPGWFHNMEPTSRILLENLLRGTETMGEDREGRRFSWQNIVRAMNEYVVADYERRGTESHELYGVTGARTNSFSP